jgi:4Fe-4S ferredoxin
VTTSRPVAEANESCARSSVPVMPVVDATRCEGKAACVDVCPYQVFEVARMPDEQFARLPLFARFKVWAHGRRTAFTPNANACEGCGLCVSACPEKAIRIVRRAASGDASR